MPSVVGIPYSELWRQVAPSIAHYPDQYRNSSSGPHYDVGQARDQYVPCLRYELVLPRPLAENTMDRVL